MVNILFIKKYQLSNYSKNIKQINMIDKVIYLGEYFVHKSYKIHPICIYVNKIFRKLVHHFTKYPYFASTLFAVCFDLCGVQMVFFHMIIELCLSDKAFWTKRTFNGFFDRVGQKVSIEHIISPKLLVADFAVKRFDVQMSK